MCCELISGVSFEANETISKEKFIGWVAKIQWITKNSFCVPTKKNIAPALKVVWSNGWRMGQESIQSEGSHWI